MYWYNFFQRNKSYLSFEVVKKSGILILILLLLNILYLKSLQIFQAISVENSHSVVSNFANNAGLETQASEKVDDGLNSILTDTINLNTATAGELQSLPGIGAKKAEDIIAYRQTQQFLVIEDILDIKGIGAATFEKLKDSLSV
ncbi:hypothetical protein AwErysi_01360 [Erysipelotrichaceae bacterium]|nr:hypothetical protein AwErysi_01360 [Erysipelotrichaceae bacterium]